MAPRSCRLYLLAGMAVAALFLVAQNLQGLTMGMELSHFLNIMPQSSEDPHSENLAVSREMAGRETPVGEA